MTLIQSENPSEKKCCEFRNKITLEVKKNRFVSARLHHASTQHLEFASFQPAFIVPQLSI
jgi:hypothetical protein